MALLDRVLDAVQYPVLDRYPEPYRAGQKGLQIVIAYEIQKNGSASAPTVDGDPSKAALRKQVFVAYSYKLYPKDDYRRVYKDLEQKFDVTFIFADEKITNMHIMKKIESYIRNSDFSIFDISGWNPNVTLELGFAMAAGDNWYIALDPKHTEIQEVPSDLRGLDRIQYTSYSDFGSRLSVLMEQWYPPARPRGTIDEFLDERRNEVRTLLRESPGLTVVSIAQVLNLEVQVVQLTLRPLLESGELTTTGVRKGTKYFLKGTEPQQQ